MKYAFWAVLGFVGLMVLSFGLRAVGLVQFQLFAPMEEDVRREVFENTNSYNRGKIQALSKYRIEYLRATDEQSKSAIAGAIRMEFADYPADRIEDTQLRVFLSNIKGGMR